MSSYSSDEEEFVETVAVTKRKGPSKGKKRKRVGRACVFCQRSHMSCDEGRPCKRCIQRGCADQCRDGKRKRRGRKRKSPLPDDEESEHLEQLSDVEEEQGSSSNLFGVAPHNPMVPTSVASTSQHKHNHNHHHGHTHSAAVHSHPHLHNYAMQRNGYNRNQLITSNGSFMDDEDNFKNNNNNSFEVEDDEEIVEVCDSDTNQVVFKRMKRNEPEEIQSDDEQGSEPDDEYKLSLSSDQYSLDFSGEDLPPPQIMATQHDMVLFPGLLENTQANFESASLAQRFPNCWSNRNEMLDLGFPVASSPQERYHHKYNEANNLHIITATKNKKFISNSLLKEHFNNHNNQAAYDNDFE